MSAAVEKSSFTTPEGYAALIERVVAAVVCVVLSPVFALNIIAALWNLRLPLAKRIETDLLGRSHARWYFTAGKLKASAELFQVVLGQLALIGLPHAVAPCNLSKTFAKCQPGVISLYGLHLRSGQLSASPVDATLKQVEMSHAARALLIVRYAIASLFSGSRRLMAKRVFSLFGVRIDNVSMAEAVAKVVPEEAPTSARLGFFVNVNSFNLAVNHTDLPETINAADWVFADGSGVRLAAQRKGVALVDNVNGTDMLPPLCTRAAALGKRLYLLGAGPGVAEAAAHNLRAQFPGLRITGCRDGYFDAAETEQLIAEINAAEPDVLLVAMGTPIQEQWCLEHRAALQVSTILAVGGLFDFYSGRIPRAPLWMRELGLEWIWRLRQEPLKKFKRYVFGNPLFLLRTLTMPRG